MLRLGKIIKATRQIVAGTKYVYDVELIEGSKTKVCNVVIVSQPWLENGIEVTFNCPDGQVVKRHSV
ncbi:sarcocystatin-A-like isoform X4 [Drosophila navojoa]|uniref:sarcocystatin-A-like isoform X4 n=1 Tax=Drosophila navojoa TaxID=7232 RepID=UPI00084659F8|nr:sarcocystatin-A-like isoform X4 [Drosophila navojoa]